METREDATPDPTPFTSMGQAEAFSQPLACIGQVALPQQEGLPGRGLAGATAPTPSTAAHTGDSMKNPGDSAPRTSRVITMLRALRIFLGILPRRVYEYVTLG
jgi:hypothetical protein